MFSFSAFACASACQYGSESNPGAGLPRYTSAYPFLPSSRFTLVKIDHSQNAIVAISSVILDGHLLAQYLWSGHLILDTQHITGNQVESAETLSYFLVHPPSPTLDSALVFQPEGDVVNFALIESSCFHQRSRIHPLR